MTYTAKRMIILLMAWGLIIFVGVTVRINMNAPRPLQVTPSPPAILADTPIPDPQAAARAALAQNPNDPGALLSLANDAYTNRDWETARTLYGRAVTLDPHNVELLVHLAASQLYALRFADAEATLAQAAGLAPRRGDVHLLYGLAASRQSPPDMARATAEWRQVLALEPGSPLAAQAQQLLDTAAKGGP